MDQATRRYGGPDEIQVSGFTKCSEAANDLFHPDDCLWGALCATCLQDRPSPAFFCSMLSRMLVQGQVKYAAKISITRSMCVWDSLASHSMTL